MKRCNACHQTFVDEFSFCPVDGLLLKKLAAARMPTAFKYGNGDQRSEFHLTLINSDGLAPRLGREMSFAIAELEQLWPEFKKAPLAFTTRQLITATRKFKSLMQPNLLTGVTAALLIVLTASLTLFVLKPRAPHDETTGDQAGEIVEIISMNLPAALPSPDGVGDGAGSNGRVGLNRDRGEGSATQPRAAHGGGGGGERNPQPASVGKIPQPSDIPAPISPALPHAALPVAGIDLDPALWGNLQYAKYGDPHSKTNDASKGPGAGGGIGNGNGDGDGSGDGDGVGPGERGNMGGGRKEGGCCGPGGSDGNNIREPNRVYRVPEVTQRARVISKPEPQYTEAARKNQVTGSVLLSVIFLETGQITAIRAIKTLPDGLTEKAIAAARQIRFIPASRNGQPVSVYMQLEYNFNLY